MVYLTCLSLMRVFKSWRNKWFGGRLPHWLRDLLKVTRFVNFVRLTPTFLAICFAPRHFYNRLHTVLGGRSVIHKTPIDFLVSSITLAVILVSFVYGDLMSEYSISKEKLFLSLLVTVFCVPLWAIVLSTLVLIGYWMPQGLPGYNRIDLFRVINYHPLVIPLSIHTYLRMRWRQVFWGLFYYDIYFYFALQLVQWVLVVSFKAGFGIIEALHPIKNDLLFSTNRRPTSSELLVEGIILCLCALVVAIVTHYVLLRPYLELLRASLKWPTNRIYRSDVFDLKRAIQSLVDALPNDKQSVRSALGAIEREVNSATLYIKHENIRFARLSDKTRQSAVAGRSKVYRETLNVRPIEKALEGSKLSHTQKYVARAIKRINTLVGLSNHIDLPV